MIRSSGDWTDASSAPPKPGTRTVADAKDQVIGETPIDETRPLGSRSATLPSSTMTLPSSTSIVSPSPTMTRAFAPHGRRFPRSLSDDLFLEPPPTLRRQDTLSDLLPTSSTLSVHSNIRDTRSSSAGQPVSSDRQSGAQSTQTSTVSSSPPDTTIVSKTSPSISVNMYKKSDGFLAERVDEVEEPPVKRVRRI